ncbi:MAG: hypothetical protein JW947_10430 [Sedimentisphaerales bacterium]|nr:hypothetical protein [Sedimentisphaerales bacterium]
MTKRRIQKKARNQPLPEPSLEHLKRLTDDTGLLQHARYIIPYREEGYCTDDNARAVIVTAKYYARYHDKHALQLLDRYLAFVLHSQNIDGSIKNLMNFDRTWRKTDLGNDALGRVLWALGTVLANPPSPAYLPIAREYFENSAVYVEKQSPRGKAYSIIGMSEYLKRFPQAGNLKGWMEIAADSLVNQFEETSSPDWQWFDNALTYDNAVLPCALFIAGTILENKYLEIAEQSCEFLLENIFNGRYFSFIGCEGWYKHGGERAQFDQQPIEAASTVLMLKAAYDAAGDEKYLTLQKKAFRWFLGENDLRIPLYDSKTKGCSDGLMSDAANPNQGAESTLSFLLALLTMLETKTKKSR